MKSAGGRRVCRRRSGRRITAASRSSDSSRRNRSRTSPRSVVSSAADPALVGHQHSAEFALPRGRSQGRRIRRRLRGRAVRHRLHVSHRNTVRAARDAADLGPVPEVQLRARDRSRARRSRCATSGTSSARPNITKAHDQITKGVAHILSQGTLPMIMGGDHSIGYPMRPRESPNA